MAISTNGTVIARLAGGLYNTVMSNATYLEVASQDPSTLANTLYARDFAKSTDLAVATTLLANLGLASQAGLDAWVAAQLTAAGAANKGAKIVSLLNDFAGLASDATWGTYATTFNTKVDAALAASQKTGSVEAKFEAAGTVASTAATFTLTTSVDSGASFTGGAGNDSFSATGATLTVNDKLDGGTGTDSLTISDLTGGLVAGVPDGVTVVGIEAVTATTNSSIGKLASTSTAVTAAVAQVATITYTSTSAAVQKLSIGGRVYESATALSSDTTGVAAATSAASLINAALGTSVASRSGSVVTITAPIAGKALPAITGAVTTTANAALMQATVAIKEVTTLSATNTTTNAMTVYIDGVAYAAGPSGANATTAGDAIASVINQVVGAGTAVNASGVVTVTAPTAGVALPNFHVAIANAGSVAVSNVVPNQVALSATPAAAAYAVSGWTDLTSFTGTATTVANVSAATTTDVTLTGTAVQTSGGNAVKVTGTDSVFVSGAKGAVSVTTGTTTTKLIGAEAADTATGTAADATGVYVTGGTTVSITGKSLTTNVKVGAAPYSKAGVNLSGFPATNGNSSKTPTGDVSITKVTSSTSTANGVVTGTYGVGTNTVYTNGATSVTATGAATTTITDSKTLYLQADAASASAPGTSTLATVTLAGLSGATTVKSDAIKTVNVSDTLTSQTVTISNSGALNANNGAITLNVSNVGTSGGARLTLDNPTATSVNVGTLAASSYGKVATGTATAIDTNTGSKSFITLTTPKATSITMTNALAVDIGTVGGTTSGVQKVGTVNASGATGSVTATIGAAQEAGMVFTGGSGADKVTLTGDVSVTSTTKATSVSLGAGNDSLLNSSATTTFTGATFDGGEGNDTVAISLLTIGNASKFTSFETLGLDVASAGTRDVSIIGGITGLNLLANSTGVVTYSGATQAQSLTITGAATGGVSNTGGTTDIDFGTTTTATTDAYTITFAGAGTSSSTVASPTTVNAGIVKIAGIEAVSLVSAGTNFTNNTIALNDSSARTMTITGDKAATITFDTGFGTASTTTTSSSGVSLIDASALTGKLVLTASSVLGTAYAGITIKGGTSDDTITLAAQTGTGRYTVDVGAGNDLITTSTTAATLTLGAGTDTVDATLTVAGTSYGSAPVITTITDFVAGDKIIMGNTTAATAAKTFVTGATSLVDALTLACSNIAAGEAGYFVYGGDTYVVWDGATNNAFSADDIVVKLTGVTSDLNWTSTGNASGLIGAA